MIVLPKRGLFIALWTFLSIMSGTFLALRIAAGEWRWAIFNGIFFVWDVAFLYWTVNYTRSNNA